MPVGAGRFGMKSNSVTGAEYGDIQTDLLGAVVPIWDAGISLPDPGFTTRFEFSRRHGSERRSGIRLGALPSRR